MSNQASRAFVTSDIHGCFRELESLLEKMNGNFRKDRLIVLGDTIDRGPQSYEVVRKLIDLQKQFGAEHCILLRGNHEQMAIDYETEGNRLWDYNGNQATIDSFRAHQDDIVHYLDVFRSWPLIYQDAHAIYVHAGINPHVSLDQQQPEDLLGIREEFFRSRKKFPKTVIYGHTPTLFLTGRDIPIFQSDRIAVDTGCVYGGSLTGLEFIDGQLVAVHQVENRYPVQNR